MDIAPTALSLEHHQMSTKAVSLVARTTRIDLLLLVILLIFILLYRLQLVASWITDLWVREALYAILYIRLLGFYRLRLTRILFLVFLFLGYSLFVGVHTYFAYGADIAVRGFMRFVNVALLAPLIAVVATRTKHLTNLVKVWLAIVCLGAASGVYQFLGGDLSWLTQGYVTSRGEALRFMTLLGEPNVGGMAAPTVLLLAVCMMKNLISKISVAMVAITLLLLSVSKASLAGFVLAIFLIFSLQLRKGGPALRSGLKQISLFVVSFAVSIAIFASILAVSNPTIMEKVNMYSQTAITAFWGADNPQDVSPSFTDDLLNRLFTYTLDGIRLAQAESDFYALNVILGSSYGIAGTAAEQVRGQDAVIAAHNGYAEIFFVGGGIMLLLFLATAVAVLRRLWWLSKEDDLFAALLVSFIIDLAYTVVYPVMSNITVGSFFWLTVGAAGNYSVVQEVSFNTRERLSERPVNG